MVLKDDECGVGRSEVRKLKVGRMKYSDEGEKEKHPEP